MSNIGGEIGGKVGNTQNPFFQSAGGVTPQQANLATYDYGQNLLEGQGQFEGGDQGGGPIDSTMATQTAGGANIGEALNLAKSSDADQTAAFKASEVANATQAANQQSTLTQINQLSKLAGQAGTASDAAAGSVAGVSG